VYRDDYNVHCFIKVSTPGVRDINAESKQNKQQCTTLRWIYKTAKKREKYVKRASGL
jgi:trehalose-6-phosphatase